MKRVFSQGKWLFRQPNGRTRLWARAMRLLLALFLVLTAFAFTPPTYAQDDVHVVARGENLAIIASHYGISQRALANANGISNPNFIFVGQRLVIPGSTTNTDNTASSTSATVASAQLPSGDGYYTVRRGDTLSGIAASNGMTMADLMRLNNLDDSNFVWVGQKLRVSARVEAVQTDKTAEPQLADTIYVVKPGDTLSSIAAAYGTTQQALLNANGLPNANFVWVGQRLRVGVSALNETTTSIKADAPTDGKRWIDVNLTTQTLTAWQGDVAVMQTSISSGVQKTPTVTGRYHINSKLTSQHMIGPGYDLPNVPWVMYFYSNYAIHGAYWHNNFGTPMSHGCINMRVGESETIFNWASIGTEVYLHY
ncbi:MAG: LysM peptidoglycan-binding domain-containing protein [Caldilineaceae bacterium]